MVPGKRRVVSEKDRIDKLMGTFKYEESRTVKLIKNKWGKELIQNELVHLANLFEKVTGFKIGRSERRNKALLIKFFEDHFDSFEKFMRNVECNYGNENSFGLTEGDKPQIRVDEEKQKEDLSDNDGNEEISDNNF